MTNTTTTNFVDYGEDENEIDDEDHDDDDDGNDDENNYDDDDMGKLSILMKIRTSITLIIEVHFLFSICFIRN